MILLEVATFGLLFLDAHNYLLQETQVPSRILKAHDHVLQGTILLDYHYFSCIVYLSLYISRLSKLR